VIALLFAMAARLLELDSSLAPGALEARRKASPSKAAGLPVPVMTNVMKRRAIH